MRQRGFLDPQLVVTWYTSIALLASSYARDQGTAIAFGVGVWFLFTMLWLLVTSVLAGLAGIGPSTANAQWVQFEAVDLLLQTASTITSSNSAWMTSTAGSAPSRSPALAWTIAPVVVPTPHRTAGPLSQRARVEARGAHRKA